MAEFGLRAFLEARLAEDELWALAASAPPSWRGEYTPVPTGVRWTWATGENWDPYEVDPTEEYVGDRVHDLGPSLVTVDEFPDREPLGRWTHFQHRVIGHAEEIRSVDGGHIVRHDPARVLREVAAKRRLLANHQDDGDGCDGCGLNRLEERMYEVADECPTLRALASVWSDHPEYLSEWAADQVG